MSQNWVIKRELSNNNESITRNKSEYQLLEGTLDIIHRLKTKPGTEVCAPAIPGTQEAKMGGSFEPRNSGPAFAT
jgi:hypothetical protein